MLLELSELFAAQGSQQKAELLTASHELIHHREKRAANEQSTAANYFMEIEV